MEMITYNRAWYEYYDRGPHIDEAKKYLEYAVALDLVRDLPHCGASLDIGTATGRYILTFSRFGYLAYGIDISLEAIEITRRNLENCGIDCSRVHQMDAQNLDFPDARFRLVSCMMGTLSHIARPDQALAEIHRVLCPGGVVLLSNWQPQAMDMDFLAVNTDEHNSYLLEKSLGLEEAVRLITDAGLVLERYAYAVLLPTATIHHLIDSCSGDPAGYLQRLSLVEVQLRRFFPRLRGQILILLARKTR